MPVFFDSVSDQGEGGDWLVIVAHDVDAGSGFFLKERMSDHVGGVVVADGSLENADGWERSLDLTALDCKQREDKSDEEHRLHFFIR